MSERLMLLDSASLYFRAFYGVPSSVTGPDGAPVNAVRGFLDMIAKLVTTYRPTRVVACWEDDWRPQWRVALLPTYKAHRVAAPGDGGSALEEVPDPLEAQIPAIREALDRLGVPIVGAAEHEADDVIGTLAASATTPVDVVTGDRDLFQVVDDPRGVRVISTVRGMRRLEEVTDEWIVEHYGIRAAQYADFATLRGDPSDGLPGVKGIGEKSAAALLRAFGDLAAIRAAARAGQGMTARTAAALVDADAYLDAASAVVRVVRDLPLPDLDARLVPLDTRSAHTAGAWAAQRGFGAAFDRAVAAVASSSATV